MCACVIVYIFFFNIGTILKDCIQACEKLILVTKNNHILGIIIVFYIFGILLDFKVNCANSTVYRCNRIKFEIPQYLFLAMKFC